MSDTVDFSALEFQRMSPGHRIRICRSLAARMRQKAEISGSDDGARCLRLAEDWDKLASEIEQQKHVLDR
jgi:hypothetical protein